MSSLSRRSLLLAPAILRAQAKPRNVLFIVSDDLASGALPCYGHRIVQTPNLDRLARESLRLDRAYCQHPLCAPSRASFLTGLLPDKTRVLTNGPDFRSALPDAVTLPQLFKNHGYSSIREGKMFHMGVPGTVGTAQWQDAPSWTHNGSPPGKEHLSRGERRKITPQIGDGVAMQYVMTPDASEQADFHAAERAIDHLSAHREKPFFLGLGFVRPHVPFVAPSRFFDLYPLDKIRSFVNPPGDLDDIPAMARTNRNIWNHMGMNDEDRRVALRAYYASISFMDEQLGRVLAALDRLGLRSHTMVTFMSDHGWGLGEHTHWQKQSLMEESTRIPLLLSMPGMRARGKSSKSLVEALDLYPTLAAWAGLAPPDGLDGQSLLPLLDNPKTKLRAFARSQFLTQGQSSPKSPAPAAIVGRAVRTERYRYILWKANNGETAEEFYDHAKDPHEFTNLARVPKAPAELAAHRQLVPAF